MRVARVARGLHNTYTRETCSRSACSPRVSRGKHACNVYLSRELYCTCHKSCEHAQYIHVAYWVGIYSSHPTSCRKCDHTHQFLLAHCARVRLARWSESQFMLTTSMIETLKGGPGNMQGMRVQLALQSLEFYLPAQLMCTWSWPF